MASSPPLRVLPDPIPSTPELPAHPWPFALHFVRQYRGWYLLILALEIAGAIASTYMPYLIGQTVKIITHLRDHPELIWGAIKTPLVVFALLNVAEVAFVCGGNVCRHIAAPQLRRRVTLELFAYLQRHSQRYITDHFAGSLAHRISETTQGVAMALATVIFEFLPIFVKLAIASALLFYASFYLGGFILAWSVIFLAVSFKLARDLRPHAKRHAAARSETNGKIVDSITNLSSVRLFARLGFERGYIDTHLDREIKAARVSMSHMEKIQWFQYSAALVLRVGVLALGAWLWAKGKIDVAGFVMGISLALLIIGEVRNLGRRFLEFFEFIGNISHGVHSIVRPHEVTDAPGAGRLQVDRGEIEFRGVSFGYTPERTVFENLHLTIRPGERVGLVGYSGSGKSSLLNLVLRLYEPQQGAILIDGTDIRQVTQESLHAQISLIPQEPGLFHRTLRENIGYGNLDAGSSEIEEASTLAHAHAFINEMPQKYESMVGERGVKLSGGQRQRIAIARVIAKDAPILIMDEATSSLDSVTERAIQESLDLIMKGKTVLVVAHRLSTIAHLDRILVFDKGQIVEDGNHSALLTRNGTYAHLWSRQVDGFIPESEAEDAATEADGKGLVTA